MLPDNENRLLIIRPLGAQGPKIGVQVSSREDVEILDEKVGELPEKERKTSEGILKAVRAAGLSRVDS